MKTSIHSSLKAIIAGGAVLALGACASLDYSNRIAGSAESFKTGAVDAALTSHESAYAGVKPADRDLLYYFERGELLRSRAGTLADSTQAWLEADARVRAWEDDAKGMLGKTAGQLGALLLNESLNRYDGQDYEKVMLNTRLAQNHLANGNWDNARIEIRKMYERETLIARLREKEVDALKEAAKAKGAGKTDLRLEEIKGYPVEIFNDPQVTGLRNAYQSAASHYLAGFVFEALSENGLAAAGYRQAIELRPDVPMLKQGLDKLAGNRRAGGGQTDTLFMVETGWLPAREAIKITLPVRIASGVKILSASYPVIRPVKDRAVPGTLDASGVPVPLTLVTNLDAMARRALKDEMPGLVARSMVRMLVSGAVQEALQSKKDDAVGNLLSLAVGIASAVTETADTRQWRTLPAYVSLGRATLKSGPQTIALNTSQGPLKASVMLQGPYAVVVVRPLGNTLEVIASQPADAPTTRVAATQGH